jgi:hypothetical protein
MTMLALLVLQFELGVATTLSDPPAIPPFGFSDQAFRSALDKLVTAGQIHAAAGPIMVIIAVVTLVLSLRARPRSVKVFGILAFLALLIAGTMGMFFVQSGFQDDNYTHGMATFFILSFIFYFLELYFLKPARPPASG